MPPPPPLKRPKKSMKSKGQRMLEHMGWSAGEGLGLRSDGIREPVIADGQQAKAGLGAPEAKTEAAAYLQSMQSRKAASWQKARSRFGSL